MCFRTPRGIIGSKGDSYALFENQFWGNLRIKQLIYSFVCDRFGTDIWISNTLIHNTISPLVLGQLLFCVIYVFLLSPVSNCWSLPIILTELLNLHIFFICKMIITCICVVVLDLHRLSWIITYSFIILLLQINIQSISCNCCGISAILSLIFITNGQPGFLQFTATTNKTIFPSLYINLYRSIWEYVFPCAF